MPLKFPKPPPRKKKKPRGLRRRTPLRARGRRGSAFPHRRHRGFMNWMLEQLKAGTPCDSCGFRRALVRAHGVPRSQGGNDRGNVALLCRRCDATSEKRWRAFGRESGVDLFARAAAWDLRYQGYVMGLRAARRARILGTPRGAGRETESDG